MKLNVANKIGKKRDKHSDKNKQYNFSKMVQDFKSNHELNINESSINKELNDRDQINDNTHGSVLDLNLFYDNANKTKEDQDNEKNLV